MSFRRAHLFFVIVVGSGALLGTACSGEESDSGATGGTGTLTGGTGGTGGTGVGGSGGGVDVGGTGGELLGGASGDGGSGGTTATRYPNLSDTGLYEADMETLAEGVREFTPQFPLWTDGAEKARWIWLPPGTQIDTSDMDAWEYPVGTKLWKEFSRDSTRVETRLLEKLPNGSWWRLPYIWNDEQTDAVLTVAGEENAKDTPHDVPSEEACRTCHFRMKDNVLGFTAVQLSHDGPGLTLTDLIEEDLLTDPPAGPFTVPGSDVEVAALGYLHANCGSCHNPNSNLFAMIDMELWLDTDDFGGDVTQTATYLTTVGEPISLTTRNPPDVTERIAPGNVDNSSVHVRMTSRGNEWDMPPLGTEDPDTAGAAAVAAWINSLN